MRHAWRECSNDVGKPMIPSPTDHATLTKKRNPKGSLGASGAGTRPGRPKRRS